MANTASVGRSYRYTTFTGLDPFSMIPRLKAELLSSIESEFDIDVPYRICFSITETPVQMKGFNGPLNLITIIVGVEVERLEQ